MPRSSRHRSHRSHRRGGSADRSESEGEESAPASGAREEASAAARVSRDPEPERRRSSSGKEAVRSGNGYAEHGKKRKERVEEAMVDVVSDRWNSGVCDDHLVDKRSKSETFGHADAEKLPDKSRGSGDESKRSSRRAVVVDDRAEEVASKSDSGKRRSEKEKDLGRREKISAKEKYNNPEMQPDKHSRRKDDPEDTDKWPADNRDSDDRKVSRYEHGKSRSSKEQRFDDDKYKEKYKDDYGRDKRQQDDKFLDERVTRHEGDRGDYKSVKDGHRSSESHYRKDAVQDGDHYEDYGNRYKESRGKKRPPEDNEDQYDLKPPSTRDQRVNLEKSSGSGRLDSLIERARPDRSSSPSKIHSRSSPSPSSYHDKDQSRHGSKVIDHGKRELQHDERNSRQRTSSTRERTPASRLRDRDAENWSSERLKQKEDHQPRDVPLEISTSSQYDRTPRKDKHSSPKQLSEKSPSSGDQRFSGRLSGGRSLDTKGERNNLTKYRDRDGDLSQERSHHQDRTPAKVPFREPTPSGSSISRGGHFSGTSPNHPLPPSARHRNDDPFLGSHDDDRRPQSGDRRFHGHQKRNDMNSVRGHGHAWNNQPNWPSPVSNGFVPMQHGAPGFHPPVHQFPGPPMFNLRPQMKLNQPGVSYPMHDAVDRFSTHMRPFGWPNPLDESCPPHMQVWTGGSGVFPGDPYLYGRQEWDQNRPHAGSRGWELIGDASKGLNEMPDAELPVAKKEPDSAATAISESSSGYNLQPQVEQKEIEHLSSENFEAKDDSRSASKSLEAPQGAQLLTSMLSKNGAVFCKSYLSRISVSHDLVESELYRRCISLLGDLGIAKDPVRNELTQRALALHKNQTGKGLIPTFASVKMEEKMDIREDGHDLEMLNCNLKESVVSNPALQHHTDAMEEGSLSKQELGDTVWVATAATTESVGVEASPAITQPDEEMELVVAPPATTAPDKEMTDVVPSANEVPADGLEDEPQATLEHVADLLKDSAADGLEDVAPSAVGESGDNVEVIPPAVTEPSLSKVVVACAVASPPNGQERPSNMHTDVETVIEDEIDKVIDDNPGDGECTRYGYGNLDACRMQDMLWWHASQTSRAHPAAFLVS
ncbi:nipped-B-like protein B [Panicum miliaceum]|uniref:Nipped-B-like protein B n=1 Tax=Panicum miliaceum TaxID=4540 RepID=A0A3L6R0P1_PANMI|nr:nipped-B-like protein B [Panicum miliaceum]